MAAVSHVGENAGNTEGNPRPEAEEDRTGLRQGQAAEVLYPDADRSKDGVQVFEIKPQVDWDKGKALQHLLEALELHEAEDVMPLYIGDDRTDEDAFKVLREHGCGCGILVSNKVRQLPCRARFREDQECCGWPDAIAWSFGVGMLWVLAPAVSFAYRPSHTHNHPSPEPSFKLWLLLAWLNISSGSFPRWPSGALLPCWFADAPCVQVKHTVAEYHLRDPNEVGVFLTKLVKWGWEEGNGWHKNVHCNGWTPTYRQLSRSEPSRSTTRLDDVDGDDSCCNTPQ